MDIEQLEALALDDDREAALASLMPGTEDYYHHRALLHQHAGELDQVDALLETWRERHPRSTRRRQIEDRQALLRYEKHPDETRSTLRRRLNLRFDHQRTVQDEPTQHPETLDQAQIGFDVFHEDAKRRHLLDGYEESAYDWLLEGELPADRRRALLERLRWPSSPHLCRQVIADLEEKTSRGFGTLPIHSLLTVEQLDTLAAALPRLRENASFIDVYVRRLRPNADVEWEHDRAAREAYLERLWAFAETLPPSFNSLIAHVLYHRLDHDRRGGVFRRERLLTYLALPRRDGYVADSVKRAPAEHFANVQVAPPSTGLPGVGYDWPLVQACLAHFFVEDEDPGDFAQLVRERELRRIFAETKILSGHPDGDRWYSMLDDPSAYQALKERVDIELAPDNPEVFAADDPVELTVDIKNVPSLTVRVFEIDAVAYFVAHGRAVDTSVDLDGLVAREEHTHRYEQPPQVRVRRRLRFDSLASPGVFVVEMIGNGRSSRALIRKGRLRYVQRVSAAGDVLTVLDESGQVVTDASVYYQGREHRADENGSVRIPFGAPQGSPSILLVHGSTTTLDAFRPTPERYALRARVFCDREQLIAKKKATAVISASLRCGEQALPLSLLEEVTLIVESQSRLGEQARSETPIELFADRETLHELKVPDDLRGLTFTVRAKVRSVSEQRDIELSQTSRVSLNGIDATDRVDHAHLSRTSAGYVLYLLGKSGEPRSEVALTLGVKHRDFRTERRVVLQTDARGRVELGALGSVAILRAHLPSGEVAEWSLLDPASRTASALHAREGEPLCIPYLPDADQRGASLLEHAGDGGFVASHTSKLALEDGYLRVEGLAAGDYTLRLGDPGHVKRIRVTRGEPLRGGRVEGRWLLGRRRMLETRSAAPPSIADVEVGEEAIVVKLANPTPRSRLHVFSRRFVERASPIRALDAKRRMEPGEVETSLSTSHYVSGRDIGDEYRYVIERKHAKKRPGNMLPRPELLLSPWALRTTSTEVMAAEEGAAYASAGAASPRRRAAPQAKREQAAAAKTGFSNLDFLGASSHQELGLRPDERGTVRLPRAAFERASTLHLVLVDDEVTLHRAVVLDEVTAQPADRSLRDALDHEAHFQKQKQRTALSADGTLTLADITTAELEAVDTLEKVHALLCALSGDATLSKLGWVTRWPSLPREEQLDRYGEHACHELNLFLYFKDRAFFDTVVRPYLANKLHKTFVDHYLLEADLTPYRAPYRYGRLNAVERILLSQRIGEEREPIGRGIEQTHDLTPPDPEEEDRLFRAAVKSGALGVGDSLGFEDAREKLATERKKKAGPPRGGGGPQGGAPPAAPRPPPSPGPAPAAAPALRQLTASVMADAPAEASMDMEMDGFAVGGYGGSRGDEPDDLLAREEARPFFRTLDKTKEWAESNYYERRIQEQTADLIRVNAFWRDYALHDGKSPFLSSRFTHATSCFAEMLIALAVLDLPFEAGAHQVEYQDAEMRLTAASPVIVFHEEIQPAEPAEERVPILVGQSYFRADDRYRFEGHEQHDKYVTGELLTHVVYLCQVVLTNPTSSTHKLDLLLQIPKGALPVSNGVTTRGQNVRLSPHGTHTVEYAFYFPRPGTYPHFPVHVTRNDQLVAFAEPTELTVVRRPSAVDTESWAYVSQRGTEAEVLDYLADQNLGRVAVSDIAWRMRDRRFYERAMAVLERRHTYDHTLYSYALHHDDAPRLGEYLLHAQGFVQGLGRYLTCKLLTVDPVVRHTYEHLEYSPLVNARAHRLGGKLKILNEALAAQYRSFLGVVCERPAPTVEDRLAASYYLLLMDRVDEGLAMFDRVDRARVESRLQHDYLAAYVALYRGEPAVAQEIAQRHREHPVPRWRKRFARVLAVTREASGEAARIVDEDDRDERQGLSSSLEPSLDFEVEGDKITVRYHRVERCAVRYYPMDIELLFSRQPFMKQATDRFAIVSPHRVDTVELPEGGGELTFELPDEYKRANAMVEITAGDLRKTQASYGNNIAVSITDRYGQLRVSERAAQRPLPDAYVKVYARRSDGGVVFYKDGYTDLRGAFDYASLSTDELDHVERFAILTLSEEHGAVIREASPPPR